MWCFQAVGVGMNLSPLSNSSSQVLGAVDLSIMNEFSIVLPRVTMFPMSPPVVSPSCWLVFLARLVWIWFCSSASIIFLFDFLYS